MVREWFVEGIEKTRRTVLIIHYAAGIIWDLMPKVYSLTSSPSSQRAVPR